MIGEEMKPRGKRGKALTAVTLGGRTYCQSAVYEARSIRQYVEQCMQKKHNYTARMMSQLVVRKRVGAGTELHTRVQKVHLKKKGERATSSWNAFLRNRRTPGIKPASQQGIQELRDIATEW